LRSTSSVAPAAEVWIEVEGESKSFPVSLHRLPQKCAYLRHAGVNEGLSSKRIATKDTGNRGPGETQDIQLLYIFFELFPEVATRENLFQAFICDFELWM